MQSRIQTFFIGCSLIFSILSTAQNSRPQALKEYTKDGITVRSVDFESFRPLLTQTNDTTYVINFWATWCAPCIKEMPLFEKITAEYKNNKVKVLLVSLDLPKQVESNLLPFIKKKKIKSEVILLNDPDANAWIDKVDQSWSGAIPATIIYNRDQWKFYELSFKEDELENELKTFIK